LPTTREIKRGLKAINSFLPLEKICNIYIASSFCVCNKKIQIALHDVSKAKPDTVKTTL